MTDEKLRRFIELAGEVAQGRYEQSEELFEMTAPGRRGGPIAELAESFGMMMVKVEGREYELKLTIENLKRKNEELAATLRKVELLEKIRAHLGKFVPESVKHIIETTPDSPDLEKHDRDVSVLFLDIAGYTRLCETEESGKVNYVVEKCFSSFLDDIYRHGGDINETAGDGLMILFQDEDKERHALNAVQTAVAIREKTALVNRELAGRFRPVTVNIGINSGAALVGSSRFEGLAGARWTFTASGPVTNVASRIGALSRNGEILIGEETARRLRGAFRLDDMGARKLKNVDEPARVFRVAGEG